MYESYYNLKAKPFSVIPDPSFIFWSEAHKLAFAMLQYGIVSHAGITVITGEIGSGKTTLLKRLIDRLPADIDAGLVSNIHGDRDDLLEWLLMSLGQDFEGNSFVGRFKRLEAYLIERHAAGKRTLLIIDEAQNLSVRALEELRLITNLNAHDQEVIQLILSGQPQLKSLLSSPDLVQFSQRVSSDFHLGLLSRNDVAAYIDHRLTVAGADRPLFSAEACDLIYLATKGTPRLINVLCDTALIYGFAREAPIISSEIVRLVLDDKREYGVFPLEYGV